MKPIDQTSGIPSDLHRLYLFHIFNGIAIAVVGNMLFVDRMFLRMGLNMSQFGLIKGVALFFPAILNFLLAPFILRLRIDHKIVAVTYLFRVVFAYLFLLLPRITHNTAFLTLGCTVVLFMSITFPTFANNSLKVLGKMHIPTETLGKHSSMILVLWNAPGTIIAILCGWYIDRFDGATDVQFYSA
ncbi:hypothetical protein ACFLQR_01335, partial [Verrucomicrobiota bacterium]